jgi:hypothetical protein
VLGHPTQNLPTSGPLPGEHLAAFIVDDVTGKFPGERLCYVCHYGEGPVALLFLRRVDESLAAAAGELERWRERTAGAQAFVAVASTDPEGDAEALRELAAEHGFRIPLTLCSEGEFGPHLYRLHPRVAVTAVLYARKTVFRSLAAAAVTPGFLAELRHGMDELGAWEKSAPGPEPFFACRLPAGAVP